MINWKIEYKIDYHISTVMDGIRDIECSSLIIETSSIDEAKKLATAQFCNIAGFKIDKVTKLWEY